MKSSGGAHFHALDHVRALAAFMVFAWHFTHAANPTVAAPRLPGASLLEQGHTGVALFMTLSGYLFARLIGDARIDFAAFLKNRALRLLPLLITVIVLHRVLQVLGPPGTYPESTQFFRDVVAGLVLPTLPGGGWSITVEFHFYLLLPLLMALLCRSWRSLLVLCGVAALLRTAIWLAAGEVQTLAYWTLIGRIDQFLFGMVAARMGHHLANRNGIAALLAVALFGLFAWFGAAGGFYGMPSYPSPHAVWVVLPAVEGALYAGLIAWYERTFTNPDGKVSRFVARIGELSYSIYLLHFFVVFNAARLVHEHLMPLDNFYVALAWSIVWFLWMVPLAEASYRYVETPFLKRRVPYIVRHAAGSPVVAPPPASLPSSSSAAPGS